MFLKHAQRNVVGLFLGYKEQLYVLLLNFLQTSSVKTEVLLSPSNTVAKFKETQFCLLSTIYLRVHENQNRLGYANAINALHLDHP